MAQVLKQRNGQGMATEYALGALIGFGIFALVVALAALVASYGGLL